MHLTIGHGKAVAKLSSHEMASRREVGAPVRGVRRTGGGCRLETELMQKTQRVLMEPAPVGAVDERNEAPSIRERAPRCGGIEPSLVLSSSLQGRISGQGEIASGGDLKVTHRGDASGAHRYEISTFGIATQKRNVLFSVDMPTRSSEEGSPGATELIVTSQSRAMSAVVDMVTVQTQRLFTAPP